MRWVVRRAYDLRFAVLASALVHDVLTTRFDNGIALHVAAGHGSPVLAVQAWVGTGSADEAPAQAGIAHAVEHMLFRAADHVVRNVELAGGEINAWTAFDHTVYHAVIGHRATGSDADGAIDAVADLLVSPRVDGDVLAREREVILEEIRQGSDDPARSVAQSLFATAYVAHPYRRPVIGTAASVAKLGEREVIDFFRSHYVAENLTLVVAGDVDPARVQRRVERRFRSLASGRRSQRVAREPMQTAPRSHATARELAEGYLAIGFHVPAASHPDLAALEVAAIVLGQGDSARLSRLADEPKLGITSAYANVHALRDPGLMVISATARPGREQRALRSVVERVHALTHELADDDLEKARIAAEAAFVRQFETAQGRARTLGWYATVVGDPQFGHVYLDRIRQVRRHDIAQAVARYIQPANASVAAILPRHRRRGSEPTHRFARDAERRLRSSLATKPRTPAVSEQRVVLANGVTVLVRRDPAVPVVAIRAVWKGGQRVESAASAGASALLARAITAGCGARDRAAVSERIDRLGGSLAGVAGRNSFAIAGEWLAKTWRDGFSLMADCLTDPTFGDLVRDQRALEADRAAQADNPTQLAFHSFSEALYGEHPYARDVLGSPTATSALDPITLARFYRATYPLSTMTLAIVGDVDVDDAIAVVKARLELVGRSATPLASTIAPPRFTGPKEVYSYLERAQAHVVIGFPGARLDAGDRFALELLVGILGGQGGRLFGELRERRGLVYRVSAHSVEGVEPGFVAIYLSCAPSKLGEAIAVVRSELARLRRDGVERDELERARRHAIGAHQIAMQRRSAIANALAYHELYGLGWQSWSRYDDALSAVTPTDVAMAAATYLRDDLMVTATVRPPATTPAATKRSRTAKPR